MKTIAIFISGRGSNMKAIVESCKNGVLEGIAKPILIFSNKASAAGLEYAKSKNIPTEVIPSKGKKRADFDQEVIQMLKNHSVDYIILAGYMRILSPEFTQTFPKRIINIHPADTYQHQGLDGYKWAFEEKLEQTKVTVHYVDEDLDTGEIIGQAEVNLVGADNLEEVEKRGLAIEHLFYSKALKELFEQH
ncbi:MAG: phosphoribosylglycinamide formyltransferase [Flavobacteriaceae bacterium]|nr:phosphoribosylglycinamide formyltransferase [Flavobacteriaceae bacterium]